MDERLGTSKAADVDYVLQRNSMEAADSHIIIIALDRWATECSS